MPTLNIVTGHRSIPVDVEYEIKDGEFKQFYVLIYTNDGPVDISQYLGSDQFGNLKRAAQIHYRELAVNKNETEINKTYYGRRTHIVDGCVCVNPD